MRAGDCRPCARGSRSWHPPVTRPGNIAESAASPEDSIGVGVEGQLRQRAIGWTAGRDRPAQHVEGGLMAWAHQLMGGGLIHADGASGMGTHAREREVAIGSPAGAIAGELQKRLVNTEEDGLCLL